MRSRIKVELAFLDPVLHLAACAVELLVEVAGLVLLARQRGDDKARVGLALGPFGLGDDAAFVAPTVARSPGKVLEATRRLAGFLALLGGLGEFALDLLDQAAVLGQAEQKVDAVGLAPSHQPVAGKA